MKHIRCTSLLVLSSLVLPTTSLVCSCSKSEQIYKVIPSELLDISNSVLYGLKEDADISSYNTLVIPEGIKCIWDNAFANTFTKTYNSNIKYLKIANSLKRIGYGAFLNDTAFEDVSFVDCDATFSYYCEIEPTIYELNNNTKHYGSFQNVRPIGNAYIGSNQTEISSDALKQKLIGSGIPEQWFVTDSTGNINYLEKEKSKRAVNGSAQYSFKLTKSVYELEVYPTVISAPENVTIDVSIDTFDYDVTVGVSINNANEGDAVDFDLTFVAKKDGKVIWREPIKGFNIYKKDEQSDTTLNIDSDGVCHGFRTGTSETEILKEFSKNALVIPANVTAIDDVAFNPAVISTPIPSSLTTVKFDGDKCYQIGRGAFYFCENVNNFELPNSIIEIKAHAFAANTFSQFVLPNKLTTIGIAGFYQCKQLTSIQFPSTLQSVGYGCFANCDQLTTLDFTNYNSIPAWDADSEIFYGVGVSEQSKGTIKIAQGQNVEQWKTFLKSINLDLDCWNIVQEGGK